MKVFLPLLTKMYYLAGHQANHGRIGLLQILGPSVSWANPITLFRLDINFGLVLQPGLITQAIGSAYIEIERTKIACAMCVYRSSYLRRYYKWYQLRSSPIQRCFISRKRSLKRGSEICTLLLRKAQSADACNSLSCIPDFSKVSYAMNSRMQKIDP